VTTSVLIVGLGRIGMGYDATLDPDAFVLSHARAFAQNPRFSLAGGVDPDARNREQFEKLYGARSFADVGAAMRALQPQVIAIATPTPQHAPSLRAVLAAGSPRAILCEKPLARDISAAREMVASCEERGCSLYVNYFRRAEPGVAEVRRRIADGSIGHPVKGVAWYSKGLLNNGSHFVELLTHWLGPIRAMHRVAPGRMWEGVDPEPDFNIRFERGEVSFLAAREEDFSHYTVELLAPNGRLRYEDGGERILWQAARSDPAIAGYRVLDPAAESIATDFARAQKHVVEQLSAALDGAPGARICSGAEALGILESLTEIWTET
jgi:predicted dehydrogenase